MLSSVMRSLDLLDTASVTGQDVVRAVADGDRDLVTASSQTVTGPAGSTDFVRIVVHGVNGRRSGGDAPTLAVVGRLGGLGVRPHRPGLVSDADGAIVAVASALELRRMAEGGDRLKGDVVILTHVCPGAPTKVNDGVRFMTCPVPPDVVNEHCLEPGADAVLSVDATKGNRIANFTGIAITPTVKAGYILRVSPDLIDICEHVTGRPARVLPITTQDITPYGNGVYHINSIMQPSVATDAPVVGVAVCAEVCVPGSATGASNFADLEQAGRFVVEVAKAFTSGEISFFNEQEFQRLLELYGSMEHLQSMGNVPSTG